MGRNKKFTGYKAFQFLEPGVDYREFKLREEMPPDWVDWVPLSKVEEERFEEIMTKSIVISLHDHPSRRPENIAEREEYSRERARQSQTSTTSAIIMATCSPTPTYYPTTRRP